MRRKILGRTEGQTDGRTDRGKTVYPLRWSGGIIIQSDRRYPLVSVSFKFSESLYLSRNMRDIADRLAEIFDFWPYNRNGLAP